MASRLMCLLASGLIVNATFPLDALAATTSVSVAQPASAQPFNAEQLDALLASIALYPDELLTQLLMASTFPLEVVSESKPGGQCGTEIIAGAISRVGRPRPKASVLRAGYRRMSALTRQKSALFQWLAVPLWIPTGKGIVCQQIRGIPFECFSVKIKSIT